MKWFWVKVEASDNWTIGDFRRMISIEDSGKSHKYMVISDTPNITSLSEYQEMAKAFAIYPKDYKVIYPALGLANKVKKLIRDHTTTFTSSISSNYFRDNITEELGDVLWYVAQMATDLGLRLDDIAHRNIVKLASRADRGVVGGSGDKR